MMKDLNISELRKKYTKGGLIEDQLPEDPFNLFRLWFREALESEVTEPNAMALATVSAAGTPHVRMVLLKAIEDGAITFYTNFNSQKGEDLKANPFAACTFWWAELERQIRLSGRVSKVTDSVSEHYFTSRPRESQIGAWASDQSKPVSNRKELEDNFKDLSKKYEGKEIPKPEHWGGYKIQVHEIEFWQGRPGRLHDRIYYQLSSGKWNRQRLAP